MNYFSIGEEAACIGNFVAQLNKAVPLDGSTRDIYLLRFLIMAISENPILLTEREFYKSNKVNCIV